MSPSALGSILIDIILPIVLIAGAGFAVARTVSIDSRSLSRLMFYFFTPALIFSSSPCSTY